MNFKRFHESKNLFDKDNTTIYNAYFDTSGQWILSDDSKSIKIPCQPNTEYTISIPNSLAVFRVYESDNASITPAPPSSAVIPHATEIIRGANISQYTFTTSSTAEIILFQGSNAAVTEWFNGLMLNTGSTPQPYEPYSSEVWHDIPHYIHKTATDTLTLPAVIYPNDTSITVGIKGNTTQSDTPSPSNPVDVNGCGDRTGNLFDSNILLEAVTWTKNNNVYSGDSSALHLEFNSFDNCIPVNATVATVNLKFRFINFSTSFFIVFWYTDGTSANAKATTAGVWTNISVTSDSNKTLKGIAFSFGTNDLMEIKEIMVNQGSTALPYEPYGIKIPISMGGTTNNVYLGEVQTTRQIKKYEFTGNEDWSAYGSAPNTYRLSISQTPSVGNTALCTHFVNSSITSITSGKFTVGETYIYIRYADVADLTEFKTYLAQQYSAGHPVTVWYVLATPQTAVVNGPLMKIGNYADSLSTSIPCTAGENTLDVQTTVPPSEVTAGFSGWHPVQSTHEKSRNLFDKDLPNTTTIGYIREDGTIGENNNYAVSNYIELQANTQYTVSNMNVNGLYPGICFYDSSKTYISGIKYNGETSLTFTTPADCKYVLMSYLKTNNDIVMLNSGSTALPYESYWK